MAARAITAGELTKLRRDNQSTRLYVAFLDPTTVYSAQVNQTFTTTDEITQVTYDTGSGTLANVKIGMTMLVGTSAGAYDVGWCRIRATPDATTFYISEESKIDWDNNQYLTVVQDFQLLPKHIKLDASSVAFMDVDVAYSDQHASPNPVPVLGPHVRVLKLAPTTASITFSGSSSYVIGGTISTYAWSCATASGSSGTGTATPTFTFNTVGWHLVQCTVTAATTLKTKTGYRWVYVYNDANKPAEAQLEECAGDAESGGWSFTVVLYDQADLTLVRDRALCVLFAEDVYGTEAGSLGPVSGAESTICWGWIAGETIVLPPSGRSGEVSFEAQGPQQWLARIPAFPVGLEDVQVAPTAWTEFEDLTVRKGAWHMLEWRTTATTIIDVNLTSDTRGLPSFEGGRGNLWDQLVQNCFATILAPPRCDRYGSLYINVDANCTPEADRGSFPDVMDLTRPDWTGQIQGERVTVPRIGQVNLSGIVYTDGEATALFSLAPGHIPKTHGSWDIRDRLLLSTQSQANELAGLILARENNQFPSLIIPLAANNRFFDITPAQYIRVTVAAADTERGFSFTNKQFIPRRVRFIHDRDSMMMTCELEVEAEVVADLGITGDAPSTPPELPLPPIPPVTPIITFPGLPAEATTVIFARTNAIITSAHYISHIYWSGDFFAGGQPTWNEIAAPNPVNIGNVDLVVARDGSVIYLMNGDSSVSLHRIWKCENWTSASPTWTAILTAGDTIPLGNGVLDTFWSYPKVIGKSLYIAAQDTAASHTYFIAKYSGASWTYTTLTSWTGGLSPAGEAVGANEATEEVIGGSTYKLRDTGDAQVGSTWTDSGALRQRYWFWRNNRSGARYIVRRHTDATWKLHRVVENDDVLSGFNVYAENNLQVRQVRGALEGTQVTLVDWNTTPSPDEGILYVSTDGATFTQKATWLPGFCEPANKAGGNTLVWIANEILNSNEFARISTDGGTNWSQMNGNIWTLVSGGVDLHIKNAWVVFKRNTASGQ